MAWLGVTRLSQIRNGHDGHPCALISNAISTGAALRPEFEMMIAASSGLTFSRSINRLASPLSRSARVRSSAPSRKINRSSRIGLTAANAARAKESLFGDEVRVPRAEGVNYAAGIERIGNQKARLLDAFSRFWAMMMFCQANLSQLWSGSPQAGTRSLQRHGVLFDVIVEHGRLRADVVERLGISQAVAATQLSVIAQHG